MSIPASYVAPVLTRLALALVAVILAMTSPGPAHAIPDPSTPYPPAALVLTCTEISWGREPAPLPASALCAVVTAAWMALLDLHAHAPPSLL